MRKWLTLSVLFLLAQETPSHASCLDRVQSFARAICGEISNVGSQLKVNGVGSVEAGTNQVIRRFVGGASGKLSGEATSDTYENLVREQLKDEHRDARVCLQNMVRVAVEQECPKVSGDNKTPPSESLLMPGEFVLGLHQTAFLSNRRYPLTVLHFYAPSSADNVAEISIDGVKVDMHAGLKRPVPLYPEICSFTVLDVDASARRVRFTTTCGM